MNELPSRKLDVLVADDSADVRAIVTFRLQSAGHDVTCAASGNEAIALLRGKYFDLVVTDVLMPNGDGYEVIQEARKLYPTTRILVMSGGVSPMDPAQLLEHAAVLGAHVTLAKPFTAREFLDALRQAVPPSETSTPFPHEDKATSAPPAPKN